MAIWCCLGHYSNWRLKKPWAPGVSRGCWFCRGWERGGRLFSCASCLFCRSHRSYVNLRINLSNGGGGWSFVADYGQCRRRGVLGTIMFRTQRGCRFHCASCLFGRSHWSCVKLRINWSNGGGDWTFVGESRLLKGGLSWAPSSPERSTAGSPVSLM